MADEWKAPAGRTRDGAVVFHDWRPIRDAIDAAYAALGRPKVDNIPTEEWNLVGLAIDFYAHARRPACVECGKRLWPIDTIRCLDCKAALCEECAPKHFWPNGRERPSRAGHPTPQAAR